MKTKKSIRKLSPLARKCAHLARQAHSLQKRLDYLVEAIAEAEMVASATEKMLNQRIEADQPSCGIIGLGFNDGDDESL